MIFSSSRTLNGFLCTEMSILLMLTYRLEFVSLLEHCTYLGFVT